MKQTGSKKIVSKKLSFRTERPGVSVRSTVRTVTMGLAMVSFMLFAGSCKNLCKDVECNSGECVADDGSCDCSGTGYEGETCQTAETEKFLGTWTVVDNGSISGPLVFDAIVTDTTSLGRVLIANFRQFTNKVEATVFGDEISIASQQPDDDGLSVAGSGTLSGTQISWSYTVTNTGNNDVDIIPSTWTRK